MRVPLARGWTVADCARFLSIDLGPGDLVDVRGRVLARGRGRRAQALMNGQPVPLTARVQRGDNLVVTRGGDVTEPTKEIARYTAVSLRTPDGKAVAGQEPVKGFFGIRREVRGLISGFVASSDSAHLTAIVHPLGSPQRPKSLALTFDDGPNNQWTPQYLEVLSSHGARGTFFVLGQAVRPLSRVFKDTLERGNEVGTHSWRHADFRRLTNAEAEQDLLRCIRVMKEQGATRVRWFRPPWGAHPARIDAVAAKLGLRIALWDVDTYDWRRPGTNRICQRVRKGLRDGCVVLMHDGPRNREQTLAALKVLIPELQKRGYVLATLSEVKGLTPLFAGEVALRCGVREFVVKPAGPNLRVTVNDRELRAPILRCGEEVLVPALPACHAMRLSVSHDRATETLRVQTDCGVAVLRLDSPSFSWAGREMLWDVPPLLYGTVPYVPLSLLKLLSGACVTEDKARGIVGIWTMDGTQRFLGLAPPGFKLIS